MSETCVMCNLPKATQETIAALARGEKVPTHCWAQAGKLDDNLTGDVKVLADALKHGLETVNSGLLGRVIEDHKKLVAHRRDFNCIFTTIIGSLFRAAEMPADPDVEFDPGTAIPRLCELIALGLQQERKVQAVEP